MNDQTLPVVAESTAPVAHQPPVDPRQLLTTATNMANELAPVIQDQKLFTRIGSKNHVHVEGWTTLATMNGYLPWEVSNVEQEDGSFVATVELRRMSDGKPIIRAQHECGSADDKPWCNRPRPARRSMAVTRATGKACRLAFSWIMVLAGYSPTPFEEMPAENGHPDSFGPTQGAHAQEHSLKPPPKTGPISARDANLLKSEISTTAKQLKLPVRESAERVLQYARNTHGVESMTQLTREQYNDVFDSVALILGAAEASENGP